MLLARGLHEQACQVTWEGSKWDTTPNNHKKKKKKPPENSQTSKQKKSHKNLHTNLHKSISEICSPSVYTHGVRNKEKCFPGSDAVLQRSWNKLLFYTAFNTCTESHTTELLCISIGQY